MFKHNVDLKESSNFVQMQIHQVGLNRIRRRNHSQWKTPYQSCSDKSHMSSLGGILLVLKPTVQNEYIKFKLLIKRPTLVIYLAPFILKDKR